MGSSCWGKGSVVICTFDTDQHNGYLTFAVDGELQKGLEIKNVFTQIKGDGTGVYPAITLCPLTVVADIVEAEEGKEEEDDERALILERAALLNMDPDVL